jgi:uncharacterized repeat protein (TIGR03806 family)
MMRALALAAVLTACRTGPSPEALDTRQPDDSSSRPDGSGLDTRPANPGCLAGPRPVDPTATVALEPVAEDLSFVRAVTVVPPAAGQERWYVGELKGSVHTWLASDPAGTHAVALEVEALASTAESQWGLLSMTLHPDFPDDPRGFFYYRTQTGDTEIAAIPADGDGVFDPDDRELLLTIDQVPDAETHVGGHLAFSPIDGFLYLSLGDGSDATGNDIEGRAQDPTDPRGSMLRLDVDEHAGSLDIGAPYRIPADNPYADGIDGAREVYATGLRNPWRFSFDSETGVLWLGDVGANCWEEINHIERGGSYGWNQREGGHGFDPSDPEDAEDKAGCSASPASDGAGHIDPVWEYEQLDTTRSVTGGYVYHGTDIPGLQGSYVFGDYRSGYIWSLRFPDSSSDPTVTQILDTDLRIATFAQSADGELLLVSYDFWDGKLYRLVAAKETGGSDPFPTRLSQTGCVDPLDPSTPAEGLIPYGVNAPLWSDGADKQRWLALPDGAAATLTAEGHVALPAGAVLMKTFSLGDQPVETRLLVRHDDGGWAGYTYAWDSDGADATLVPSGRTAEVAGQLWQYPTPNQCLDCHTSAAGWSLGLELAQLNGDWTYAQTGRTANQLATWAAIGLLDADALGDTDDLPALVGLGAADTDAAVRSYLHSNCASCHRPGSTYEGSQDLRFDVPFSDMALCDVVPGEGDLGLTDARLIAPGDPQRSILLARMEATDAHRMPPLGRMLVHQQAVARVRGWIAAMTGCQ